jgi:hypothetical protein
MTTGRFPYKIFVWVTIFAIAMGFLETSVVVYLRALFYPNGFTFPLVMMSKTLAVTEMLREAATIVMLAGVGILAGKQAVSQFAWFMYAFAVWDILYYVFLKLLLNWPASLMTWDILFLIPANWVGPVITPVIVSFTMIIFAVLIIYFEALRNKIKIRLTEWLLLISGSMILILAFTWDYSSFILEHYPLSKLSTVPQAELYKLATAYVPRKFNWWLFWLGESVIIAGVLLFWKRYRRKSETE